MIDGIKTHLHVIGDAHFKGMRLHSHTILSLAVQCQNAIAGGAHALYGRKAQSQAQILAAAANTATLKIFPINIDNKIASLQFQITATIGGIIIHRRNGGYEAVHLESAAKMAVLQATHFLHTQT